MSIVSILFKGEDGVSSTTREVKGEIADLEKQVEKTDGKGKSLWQTLGGAGKFVAGATIGLATGAVAGLGAALISGVADAREANLVMAQTESVIKSTGGAAGFTADQIAEMAGSLSAAEGKSLFGDSDIQKGQNLLLTFTEIKETLPEATGVMVDLATAMGTDVSGGAVQLGKALNDPINGVSALSRVGVSFTDQQKEQIKTMQEAGDMAGAQRIILAELNKEFGGSAAAAAAADGGMTQFKDRMGELAESIGARVLPALNMFMGWLNSPEVQAGISVIVDAIMNGLGAAFTWVSGTALPALQAAFQVIWPIIQAAVQGVVDWFQATALPIIQQVFDWIMTTGLPTLQSAFQTIWPVIQAAVDTAFAFLRDVVWPWFQTAFALLRDVVLPSLQAAFDEVWPKIQAAIKAVFDWLQGTFFPWLQGTAFPWLADVALPALRVAFEVAWAAISTAVQLVYTFLRDTVWPWLRDTAFPWLADVAMPAIRKAFETAWPLIQAAVNTVYTFLLETVWPWLSTALADIGVWIGAAQVTWSATWVTISGAVSTAQATISGVIETIKNLVQGAIGKINELINLINNIPGVNIPNIPSGTGSGGSGFGGNSLGTNSLIPGGTSALRLANATTAGTVVNIDARGASDPRGVGDNVDRAMRAAGHRADIRLRTS